MRRITWPSTQLSVCSPPGALRDVILLRGIEPNMRWRQFCAELLAAAEELGAELVVTLGRAARRHPAHPPDPGVRHGDRAGDRRPAQARAVELRGADRHRRGLPGRLRPHRHAGGVVLGGGPPLRRPAAVPQGDAGAARASSRTCSRSASRSATCPRTPGPGSAGSTSWPRRTRRSATTSARSRRPATPPTSPRPAARRSPASSSATSSAARTRRLTGFPRRTTPPVAPAVFQAPWETACRPTVRGEYRQVPAPWEPVEEDAEAGVEQVADDVGAGAVARGASPRPSRRGA